MNVLVLRSVLLSASGVKIVGFLKWVGYYTQGRRWSFETWTTNEQMNTMGFVVVVVVVVFFLSLFLLVLFGGFFGSLRSYTQVRLKFSLQRKEISYRGIAAGMAPCSSTAIQKAGMTPCLGNTLELTLLVGPWLTQLSPRPRTRNWIHSQEKGICKDTNLQ